MTGRADSAQRTLALRPGTRPAVLVNWLVSRGLQELTSLTALPADALLAAGDIFTAAMNGDVVAVRLILANDPEQVNARDSDERTPLHYLAGYCLVTHRCTGDADVDEKLRLAEEAARYAVVGLLLASGADVNARRPDDLGTPLHWVAELSRIDLAELLLSQGAETDARDEGGWTPLRQAAFYEHEAMVGLLLSFGAEIDAATECLLLSMFAGQIEARDNTGRTRLHRAAG